MNFKERVLSMKPSEIIMAMVKGLRKRHAKIDMSSYGTVEDGICYGCAATNCILEIDNTLLDYYKDHLAVDEETYGFIDKFESSINNLRSGDIDGYNYYMVQYGLENEIVTKSYFYLPMLNDDFTEKDLLPYVELAEYNKSLDN